METRCTECQGRRIVSRMQPEIKRSQGFNYHTGRMVERLYQCEQCGGSGIATEPPALSGGDHRYKCERCGGDGCEHCLGTGLDREDLEAFEVEGKTVTAPGFTRDQFLAFVTRAKEAQLRTTPAKDCVLVMSGSSDARYAVRRDRCDCQGHMGHGRCYHRALCIYLQDVQGVDVMHVPTIGFSKRGLALTTGRKVAATASSWLDRPIVDRFRVEVA